MRISELLHAMASWLESPNNEAMLLADTNEKCMKVVAESCVLAAALLKQAADEVDELENKYQWKIVYQPTDDHLETMAEFVGTYDEGRKLAEDIVNSKVGDVGYSLGGDFNSDGGSIIFYLGTHGKISAVAKKQHETNLTPESIEETAALASAFDASGDPQLKKMASVLDELLLSIAAPPNMVAQAKMKEDARMEALRQKYQKPREDLKVYNKVNETEKVLAKSPMMKEYKILEYPLSSRYCPEHFGSPVSRVGEHTWQCELDKKVYNYDTGFTLENGDKVPGGDVSLQTGDSSYNVQSIFDSRNGRLNYHK